MLFKKSFHGAFAVICDFLWIWFFCIFYGIHFSRAQQSNIKDDHNGKEKRGSTMLCSKDISLCFDGIRSILNDTRFTYPDQDLDVLCLHFNKTMDCLNDFSRCDDKSSTMMRDQSSTEMKLLVDKLCSRESQLRREYLEHASCYHKLSPVYKKCHELFNTAENQRAKLDRNISQEQSVELWCCNNRNLMRCTTTAVSKACGTRAAKLTEQIVNMSGQDTSQHCAKDIFQASYCLQLWRNIANSMNLSYNFQELPKFDYHLFQTKSSSLSISISNISKTLLMFSNLIGLLLPIFQYPFTVPENIYQSPASRYQARGHPRS